MDPLEWCRKMHSEVMVYYKLAELWMRRRDENAGKTR